MNNQRMFNVTKRTGKYAFTLVGVSFQEAKAFVLRRRNPFEWTIKRANQG
jgi:hypothetical protein